MNTQKRLAPTRTARQILAITIIGLCLLAVPWVSEAFNMPDKSLTPRPDPIPSPPPLPYSSPGLYPPGMGARNTGNPAGGGVAVAGSVGDAPDDRIAASLAWPYQSPDYGLTVAGTTITSEWHLPALAISSHFWFAATFQEIDGELQVRDVAPNTGPVLLGSGPISDGHEVFPRWVDILAGDHAWCGSYCSVFTMTVAQDIPSNARDVLYAWPLLDKYGNLHHMPTVYLGPVGWEHATSSAHLPTRQDTLEAEIFSAAVRRQWDGWIELELVSNLPPLTDQTDFGYFSYHAAAAWFFDADDNPGTGAPSGADVMVEVRANSSTRTYEAIVKRWEGRRWVDKIQLQPPSLNLGTKTLRVRVGPATLALSTHFSWWATTAMIGGLPLHPYVTNEIDWVPNVGVVSEGPDFWVVPTRTPTPTLTPTRTPTRTSTPAPLVFNGIVQYVASRGTIAGAELWVEQKQGTTWVRVGQGTSNANGQYSIALSVTRIASYRLYCRITGPLGPREQVQEFSNVPAGTMRQDFWFEPVIRVRGRVTFDGGNPAPSTVVRRLSCAWIPGCVTFPWMWWDEPRSGPVAIEADGRFDADGYFPWGPPDSIRLKLFPPAGQRVADVVVPDICEAVAVDLVECLDLREGVYDGVKFYLAPALTPTPTPTATPTGPWIAWTDPDGLPIGVAGRTVTLRFEALPYTDTLTVTLGPGLEFTDGSTEKTWALRVLRGRMPITVRALQTHLGQQSWIRGALLGMEANLPVRLVWQTWLPGTFRHTGWRNYTFGVRFVDAETNQPLRATSAALDKCTAEPCEQWQILASQELWTPDARVIWEPEGMKPPFTFRIQFSTVCDCWNKYYVLDHVEVDGPGILGEHTIEYRNLPSGRYVNNVVYLRPVPRP